VEEAGPGADVCVTHMPPRNLPLTFYLLSARRLFTSFLPQSHNFRNEGKKKMQGNPAQMKEWKAVTWPPGAILVALHAASVDGEQYQLMFMPYGPSLFTYQHQNPTFALCNSMGSYGGQGHSLIRRAAENMSHANED